MSSCRGVTRSENSETPSDTPSYYRRELPRELVALESPEGRKLFAEALTAGHLEAFFPLVAQFHTQSEPAFCGLASLVMVLNASNVDPKRPWKGVWRWYSEEVLQCCAPLDHIKANGTTMEEVNYLAECNGLRGRVVFAQSSSLDQFRADLVRCVGNDYRTSGFMVASYDRLTLGQTGTGHFSPIAGYHQASDACLVLDTARFKYPPHWVPLTVLFQGSFVCVFRFDFGFSRAGMTQIDPDTSHSRGYLMFKSREGEST